MGPAQEQANLEKHRITFSESTSVFADPLARVFADEDHPGNEQREIIIGHSSQERLLVVSFTEKVEDVVRIINARAADPDERRDYEEETR